MGVIAPIDIGAQSSEWQAKHAKAMRRVEMLETQARTQLRLVGPAVEQDDTSGIRRCLTCNPPPKMHRCPVCDWETEDRWRLKLHIDLNPKWCREWGAKKARRWASKV